MKRPIVVIGGSGFARTLKGTPKVMKTRFGSVPVLVSELAGRTIYAIMRHGEGHVVPPHKINHKAHIWLAKDVDAEAILASAAVGIVTKETGSTPSDFKYRPGDLILFKDLMALNLRLSDASAVTFIEEFEPGKPVHPDASEMFSETLKGHLILAAHDLGLKLKLHAVLGLTYGPRYETPAEIRALKILGVNLVGMTAVFEAILANELDIDYNLIGIGSNWGAGVIKGKPLAHPDVEKIVEQRGEDISKLLTRTIERI